LNTYVDASVVLRIVLGEEDPLKTWEQLEPCSSEIVRVECLRVIERYRLAGAITDTIVAERRAAVLEAIDAFDLVGISGSILARAGDPFPTSIATLDAIHLASALQVRDEFPETVFATHDRQLGLAAQSLGFTVLGV
jgi:predicted nucleic acid-binding protein